MVLTSKTSASLQKQLFDAIEAENQLLEAELKVKKNPEDHLSSAIGFVADHLEYGCKEGVQIFKVSVPPLESFVAVRGLTTQRFQLLNSDALLARAGNPSLSLLMAVDLKQSGVVDRLYAADEDHIWSIDLTNIQHGYPYQYRLARLAGAKYLRNLRVVSDPKGSGLRLYFLCEHAQQKGLYMIKDPLSVELSEVTLIAAGDYQALFVQFGRLLLVSADPSHKPEALDLPFHQTAPINWNASCQLTSLLNRLVEDKLGRIAWRKIKR